MDFKISSDFNCDNVVDALYRMNADEILAYLKKNESKIKKLNEHIYLIFIRNDTAFTITVNDNGEIVNMCEMVNRPRDYYFYDNLLLIMDDCYQSYYNKATLYRVTSTDVEELMELSGE